MASILKEGNCLKIEEVKRIMDENHRLYNNKPSSSWATIDAAPFGIIETQEQYDYIIEYSNNSEISMEEMKPFDQSKGMYLNLGNHFCGAAFSFCVEPVERIIERKERNPDLYPENLNWSYGKYGRIDWE